MKIIAKTTSKSLLVEMTEDELARIIGYTSSFKIDASLGNGWNDSGKEYKSDERFEQLQSISSLPSNIKSLDTQLKAAQAAVDKAIAVINRSDISVIKPAKSPY